MQVLFIIFLFLIMASCHKDNPVLRNHEKSLRIAIDAEPYSLDPRHGGYRGSQTILRMLFEGLMRIGKDNLPIPGIAERVVISSDQLTYTFHLRKSNWSNGMPVTAQDFEHAWKTAISPESQSSFGFAFFIIKNAKAAKQREVQLNTVGICSLDDQTLEVTLEHPAPYFLELIANPLYAPVCRRVDEVYKGWSQESAYYVSNGPFKLTDWKHHRKMIVEKNPSYWDAEQVQLEGITIQIIPDSHTALNMYLKGVLDWAGEPLFDLPLDAIRQLKTEGKLHFHPMGGLYWYEFNVDSHLFHSSKLRKAFALAVNRQEIVDHLLQGGEQPAFSLIPPNIQEVKPSYTDGDTLKARSLFDAALHEIHVVKENLTPITITHSTITGEKTIAEALQQQWKEAFQIPIQLEAVEHNVLMDKFVKRDFQMAGSGWLSWHHDPMYTLEYVKSKSNGFNGTGWEHPLYISLLDAADHTIDVNKRKMLLREAETLLMEEMPIIPLYITSYKYLKTDHLNTVFLSDLGQIDFKWASLN